MPSEYALRNSGSRTWDIPAATRARARATFSDARGAATTPRPVASGSMPDRVLTGFRGTGGALDPARRRSDGAAATARSNAVTTAVNATMDAGVTPAGVRSTTTPATARIPKLTGIASTARATPARNGGATAARRAAPGAKHARNRPHTIRSGATETPAASTSTTSTLTAVATTRQPRNRSRVIPTRSRRTGEPPSRAGPHRRVRRG